MLDDDKLEPRSGSIRTCFANRINSSIRQQGRNMDNPYQPPSSSVDTPSKNRNRFVDLLTHRFTLILLNGITAAHGALGLLLASGTPAWTEFVFFIAPASALSAFSTQQSHKALLLCASVISATFLLISIPFLYLSFDGSELASWVMLAFELALVPAVTFVACRVRWSSAV